MDLINPPPSSTPPPPLPPSSTPPPTSPVAQGDQRDAPVGARTHDAAIELHDLRKSYRPWPWSRGVAALRGVTFNVRRGEVFGLLGPNGAGKSTLVKILMTVIRASHGRGSMLGRRVGSKGSLRRIGYLPEHHRFPDYLTAAQVMEFFAGMSGLSRRVRRTRSAALLDQVGLSRWAHAKVRSFSKGMRQRLGIAQALVNDPELLLLDEPTDGVDPVGRRDIRELLLAERARGRTVFLNSHLLSELEMVCDRVAIMVKGRVTQLGTIDELTEYGQRYEIEAAAGASADDLRHALEPPIHSWTLEPSRLAGLTGSLTGGGPHVAGAALRLPTSALAEGAWVQIDGRVIRVGTASPASVQPLIDRLRARGVTIASMRCVRPSLEDLFMRAVTDESGNVLKPGAAEGGEA